jgi:hypothetical protein
MCSTVPGSCSTATGSWPGGSNRERYDVRFVTSYDLHGDSSVFDNARLFVSAFHDEYWSTPMRTRLEDFIGSGGNAAFLAANSIYWRIRLDDSTMTCHKTESTDDDPHPDITARWRDAAIGRPEHDLLGSWYESYQFPYGAGYDWTVSADDHWLYEGTGLTNGDIVPGLVGYEWDHAPDPLPNGVRRLSRTEFRDGKDRTRRHEAVERIHPGGGRVLNVGTTYWPRMLVADAMFRADRNVERGTRNIFHQLG